MLQAEFEPETGSVRRRQIGFDFDLRAMSRADRAHDRQTKAGAAALARARLIDAIEAIEDVWQRHLGDADAGIAHFQNAVAFREQAVQAHDATGWREFDGVVEQIDDDLLEPPAITSNRHRYQRRRLQLYAPVFGDQSHLIGGAGGKFSQIHVDPLALRVARVQ